MKYGQILSLTALCLLFSISHAHAELGTWTTEGPMATSRGGHTATLLPSGEVLVVGGSNNINVGAGAELYVPGAATWMGTGSPSTARYQHTATLLASGKVLVTGGYNVIDGVLPSSEIYDPSTGTWAMTGTLGAARELHTATLLPSGRVLVTGGVGSSGSAISSSELYDPVAGMWATTENLGTARYSHTATLLPSGKVLVAGGYNGSILDSSELYDPLTGKWTIKENLGTARYSHTATLLASGKVLIVAGQGPGFGYISSAELYDPSAATWTNTGSLSVAHNDHTATLLNNGFVLVTGGDGGNGAVASAELYNPEIGTWTSTGNLATARFTHTATLMPSGQVLVAGGYNSISGYLDSSELYDSTTVTSITGPSAPLMLGGAATVTANFVDLGNQDTNTCSIAWGDGTSSAGAVSEVNGSGTCTGYHQYTATGVYEVTFTITDNYKATGTGVFQFVVMYDPSGGFVTGGGWINSPAGAYQANPSLTGRANFGFVSKYQHGATVPTGNTEFNFSVASFDFQSSVYEWMVISGGKARYRGTGSVNGSGGYGFELTAWDGQVNGGGGSDKFRIKIWDQNQGNAVVYDNQMGAPDGTDPTMVLGGGSIVIHQ